MGRGDAEVGGWLSEELSPRSMSISPSRPISVRLLADEVGEALSKGLILLGIPRDCRVWVLRCQVPVIEVLLKGSVRFTSIRLK
jgi:hypothetical protein